MMILPAFFSLLFLTTIGSGILYLRTTHDIFGVLAIAMGIACLIWGLVIAHWSIHILALLALLACGKPATMVNSFSSNK
jgi:hypothetical protein